MRALAGVDIEVQNDMAFLLFLFLLLICAAELACVYRLPLLISILDMEDECPYRQSQR